MKNGNSYLNHTVKTKIPGIFNDFGLFDSSCSNDVHGSMSHERLELFQIYPCDESETPSHWCVVNLDTSDTVSFLNKTQLTPDEVILFLKQCFENGTFCSWCEKHFYETELNEHGHCDRCQRAIDSRA